MNEIIKLDQVEKKVITLRNKNVILDSDVAELYGVESKRINEAVRNNPDKFPKGYVFEVDREEVTHLRSKFSTANISPMSRVLPKAFTEKGLYMLATILKSEKATQTTIAIVETFAQMREFARTVNELSDIQDKDKQKLLMKKSGDIIGNILDDNLSVEGTETTIELNLAVMKVKHTIKRK